jgi:hypothetical protein
MRMRRRRLLLLPPRARVSSSTSPGPCGAVCCACGCGLLCCCATAVWAPLPFPLPRAVVRSFPHRGRLPTSRPICIARQQQELRAMSDATSLTPFLTGFSSLLQLSHVVWSSFFFCSSYFGDGWTSPPSLGPRLVPLLSPVTSTTTFFGR